MNGNRKLGAIFEKVKAPIIQLGEALKKRKTPSGKPGVISRGIKTPIIKPGDDLVKIVVDSVLATVGMEGIQNKDVVAVTEAVVAISQNNIVSQATVVKDLETKFAGATSIAVVDPIQSRNRFMAILKAVAAMRNIHNIYVVMSYPTDEVGNRLISDEIIMESGVNPYTDLLTEEEFYAKLGVPCHEFTNQNYLKMYKEICGEKGRIILCNDLSKIPGICPDILLCNIHKRVSKKQQLLKYGATRVLDMSEIMNTPVNGSAYNEKFGLYGSNIQDGDDLKLMPIHCDEFVHAVQVEFKVRTGKHIEVMVYGDGAFKDPVGGIWELADPTTTPAATECLAGTPEEVKLKYIASEHKDKSPEEIEEIVAQKKAERLAAKNLAENASLGTTPRQITDLLASLSDLTSGSGDRQTPVILVQNYL